MRLFAARHLKFHAAMKYLFSALLVCLSFFTPAQSNNTPLLHVVGNAKVTVTPDIGILNIHVSSTEPTMSGAIKTLGDKTRDYTQILTQLGFKQEDIKTTGFSVAKNRIYPPRGGYIDSGYIASQNIRLEFANEKDIFSRILNKFAASDNQVDFSFDFKLSDKRKKEVEGELLKLAIKDAQQKAQIMAEAAGKKLVRIQSIRYGQEQPAPLEAMGRDYKFAALSAGQEQAFYFTPDDLLFTDTVSMDWVIE